MGEKYSVIDKRPLVYEGYFRPDELFSLIKKFLLDRKYAPIESKNFEEVHKQGRQITVELVPFRNVSDYVQKAMKINITMVRLTEELIELDGIKKKYHKGQVKIVADAMLKTDFRSKWDGSGMLYFFRVLHDKFIRKDWISSAKDEVGQDLEDLLSEVSAYLNMMRFKK